MLAHTVLLMTGLSVAVAARAGVTLLTLRSGTPQSAHAMVSVGTKQYEAVFTKPLVVHVTPDDAKVRFTCITPGCTFPPQVQGDNVNRANASAYDVDADNGVASISLTVRTLSVERAVIVAQAANGHGPPARFVLNER